MNGSGQSLGIDRGSSALNIRLHAFLLLEIFTVHEFFFETLNNFSLFWILKNFPCTTFTRSSRCRREKSCYYFAIKSSSIVNWFIENIFTFFAICCRSCEEIDEPSPWQCRSLFKLSLPQTTVSTSLLCIIFKFHHSCNWIRCDNRSDSFWNIKSFSAL